MSWTSSKSVWRSSGRKTRLHRLRHHQPFLGQPKPAWSLEKGSNGSPLLHPDHADVPMMSLGGRSTWSTTFHAYGVFVSLTDTVYYFGDIEVLRNCREQRYPPASRSGP